MLLVVLSAVAVYGRQSAATKGEPDRFTIGTAILIAGYVMFPVVALLVAGLLLIALMLLAARAIERGRSLRQ